MAIKSDIAPRDTWFTGEDKQLSFEILQADGATPQDISGWALQWVLRQRAVDADPALVQKATGGAGIVIAGVYNADRAVNTQRALVTVASADTDALASSNAYAHALKRTDAGSETVLAYGSVALMQAATH